MKRSLFLVAIVIAIGFLPIFPAASKRGPTDYELELKKIDASLAAKPTTLRGTGFLYQRAALTADFNDFRAAERAIEQAFAEVGPSEDLLLLRANFNFKLHRLDAAENDLLVREPADVGGKVDVPSRRGFDLAGDGLRRAADERGIDRRVDASRRRFAHAGSGEGDALVRVGGAAARAAVIRTRTIRGRARALPQGRPRV